MREVNKVSANYTEANYENSVIELFRNDLGYEYVYGPASTLLMRYAIALGMVSKVIVSFIVSSFWLRSGFQFLP